MPLEKCRAHAHFRKSLLGQWEGNGTWKETVVTEVDGGTPGEMSAESGLKWKDMRMRGIRAGGLGRRKFSGNRAYAEGMWGGTKNSQGKCGVCSAKGHSHGMVFFSLNLLAQEELRSFVLWRSPTSQGAAYMCLV